MYKYCFGSGSALPVSQVQIAGYAYQINYLAYLIEKLQTDVANLDPESEGEAISTLQSAVQTLQEAVQALQEAVADKSEVVANPASTGSETDLTTIEIDGTVYSVPETGVKAEVVSMQGSLEDTGDSVTLGKVITGFDFVSVTCGYSSTAGYVLASATFAPQAMLAQSNNVTLTGIDASGQTVYLHVSINGTTMACLNNSGGYTWLPVKMIGFTL